MRAASGARSGRTVLEDLLMKRLLASTFVAAGAAALLATGAVAQMNSGTGRTGTGMTPDTGMAAGQPETIVSVDPTANRIVVENAAGQQRTIRLDNTTGIQRQAAPGTTATTMRIAQLSPGDRIIVNGSTRAGSFMAQRIDVLPSGGVGAPGVTPGANPASPPGSMRPGAPSANPTGPPSGSTGGSPSGSTGGSMGGSGTGGSGGGTGGGAGGAGGGAGGGGGGGGGR
jgi:hypothetical protein